MANEMKKVNDDHTSLNRKLEVLGGFTKPPWLKAESVVFHNPDRHAEICHLSTVHHRRLAMYLSSRTHAENVHFLNTVSYISTMFFANHIPMSLQTSKESTTLSSLASSEGIGTTLAY